MQTIDEVYRNLTGVDIQAQCQLWDERGKGYYGEYLVFKELYHELTGCCKILMNIEIPTGTGRTTEIDLLLIHETGLYVFEMKHYKGTIYGKVFEEKWTQYFRTAPNSHFRNPIHQNQYHIQALHNMFPGIPIHSLIVFTSPECDLRVECNEPNITVCQLRDLSCSLHILYSRNQLLDMVNIDDVFGRLIPFSPIAVKPIVVDGQTIPFYNYLNTIIDDFHNESERLADSYFTAETKEKRKTFIAVIAAAIVSIACIATSIFACLQYRTYANSQISAAEQQLSEFAQKFEHVGPHGNSGIVMTNDFIVASDVQLSKSADIVNAVNLSFTLTWNGDNYGANISRNTKIIVILKDGSVKEYDLLEKAFPYSASDLRLGKGNVWYSAYAKYEFPVHELHGLNIEDISYIKLSNLDIWTSEAETNKPILIESGYEVKIC